MQLGLYLGLTARRGGGADTPVPSDGPATVTLANSGNLFPIANAVFDSGAARGVNAAGVRVTLTPSETGKPIHARIRTASGSVHVDWAQIGTSSGTGEQSFTFFNVPRSGERLVVDVAYGAGEFVTSGRTFMVGHVVVLLGQSEDARMFSDKYDRRDGGGAPLQGFYQTVPAFANAAARDSFFIATFGDPGEGEGGSSTYAANGIIGISDSTPFTASVAHMANIVTRNAPGEKFLFINAAQSGSSMVDLADDSDLDRDWDLSFADGVALIRSYGGDVGACLSTWTAAPSASGDGYRIRHTPFYAGIYVDGSDYILGDAVVTDVQFDNLLWDLSGLARSEAIFQSDVTKALLYGCHRFEDYTASNTTTRGFVDPAGTYDATYTSNALDAASAGITLSSTRIYTVVAGTSFTVEGSADGSTGWTAVTLDDDGVVDTVYAFYRVIAVDGGRYGISNGNGGLLQDKQDTTLSIRTMAADPQLSAIMLPKGPQITAYMNGSPANAAGNKVAITDPNAVAWTDWAHPSDYSDDGLTARARHTAVSTLYALARGPAAAVNRRVPKFNRAAWTTTHVDLWYEAPDGSTPAITTTTLARGETLTTEYLNAFPHRTHVAGFYINNVPAQRVEIVSDRVRVYPDGVKAALTGFDTIQFGLGGGTGNLKWPEDPLAQLWKNLPIADMGFTGAGLNGIAMEPMPDPDDIASTLAAPPTFLTAPTTGPAFEDPNALGAGEDQLTFRAILSPTPFASGAQILVQQIARCGLERLNDGTTRISITGQVGGSNTSLVNASTIRNATLPDNITREIVWSIDLASQRTRIFVGPPGAIVMTDDIALDFLATQFDPGRDLRWFGAETFGGTITSLEIWKGYTADGDVSGLGTAYKTITADVDGNPVESPASPVWERP